MQRGDELRGLCCVDNKLYCVQIREKALNARLCLYQIGAEIMTLLDNAEVEGVYLTRCQPEVDRQTHRVYVPSSLRGVSVFSCEDSLLRKVKMLTCVKFAASVAVKSSDYVFVIDWNSKSVCLVHVSKNSIIMKLQAPTQMKDIEPIHLTAMGSTLLVQFGDNCLVLYRNDDPHPTRVLQSPEARVISITTDCHSSFLATDNRSRSVFVLDDKGKLRHRIHADWERDLVGCAVVQEQLWLGYKGNTIDILASQGHHDIPDTLPRTPAVLHTVGHSPQITKT